MVAEGSICRHAFVVIGTHGWVVGDEGSIRWAGIKRSGRSVVQ